MTLAHLRSACCCCRRRRQAAAAAGATPAAGPAGRAAPPAPSSSSPVRWVAPPGARTAAACRAHTGGGGRGHRAVRGLAAVGQASPAARGAPQLCPPHCTGAAPEQRALRCIPHEPPEERELQRGGTGRGDRAGTAVSPQACFAGGQAGRRAGGRAGGRRQAAGGRRAAAAAATNKIHAAHTSQQPQSKHPPTWNLGVTPRRRSRR